jgi:cell wall-associated NlpC family hydrolase
MTTVDLPMYAPLDSQPGSPGHVTRADVVKAARSWLGTPYIHQHRAKGHGVDCVGLVIGVARELGIVAPDFDVNAYERTPDGSTMIAQCDRFMDRLHMDSVLPGNVLVYEFDRRLGPQHMGIVGDYYDGGLSLIQALGKTNGKGEVVEWNIGRPRRGWAPVQAYALRGVV